MIYWKTHDKNDIRRYPKRGLTLLKNVHNPLTEKTIFIYATNVHVSRTIIEEIVLKSPTGDGAGSFLPGCHNHRKS